ncbi:hypothetical protein [Klebsiella variicola]|uniref:hypothetical protein n=1 Tax=Klebsiella variicola TaxID=244366 RepID=UPI003B5D593B|nr:hypothetical protein [Klebsiella variicola]
MALRIIIFIGMPVVWRQMRAIGYKRLMGERLVMIPLLTPPLAFPVGATLVLAATVTLTCRWSALVPEDESHKVIKSSLEIPFFAHSGLSTQQTRPLRTQAV